MKAPMHVKANADKFKFAQHLRDNQTPQEIKLWEALRDNKVEGFKFRRQHPLNRFITDFYCHKAKLVIEVDGVYHDDKLQKQYDDWRSEIINYYNIKVLRFRNEEIDNDFEAVLNRIKEVLRNSRPE